MFSNMSTEHKILSLENHLNKLKANPVENAGLIKKTERILRQVQKQS